MIYLQLFISFIKIGFTSFGGLSMIPVILQEMQTHHWMTTEDMSNLIAIAEMTPGPLGLNCATFAGEQTAGFLGGVAAVTGVLMPTLTLTFLVAIFFTRFRENKYMEAILLVIRPICVGMVTSVIIELSMANYFVENRIDPSSVGIGILMFYLILKRKWTVPKVIFLSAVLGIIFNTLPGIL